MDGRMQWVGHLPICGLTPVYRCLRLWVAAGSLKGKEWEKKKGNRKERERS